MILCTLNQLIATRHTWMRSEVAVWLGAITNGIIQGHHDIDAHDYANVESPVLRTREDAPLEAHRRYIDIHIPLNNTETIGWAPTDALTRIVIPGYNAERDIAFYEDKAQTFLDVQPGQCAVFFPEDAHAPNRQNAPQDLRKNCHGNFKLNLGTLNKSKYKIGTEQHSPTLFQKE